MKQITPSITNKEKTKEGRTTTHTSSLPYLMYIKALLQKGVKHEKPKNAQKWKIIKWAKT